MYNSIKGGDHIMDIGNRLRTLRENIGLTQEEVGKLIGVTKATVNRYETEEIDIKRTIAIKLAKVLNTTPSYIMGWGDNPNTGYSPSNKNLNTDNIFENPLNKKNNEILDMYNKLDIEDKAEIRGTIKQMLKAEKYSNNTKKISESKSNNPTKVTAEEFKDAFSSNIQLAAYNGNHVKLDEDHEELSADEINFLIEELKKMQN